MLSFISFVLVCIGSLNWFSIGLLQYDFVAGIFGSQANIFSRLVYGKYAESTEKHSGDLMTRLTSDVTMVSEQYVHLLPRVVSST